MGVGGSKRNKSGVADVNAVNATSDDVVAITPEQAQAIAQDKAEANNARLKERRAAAQGLGRKEAAAAGEAATPDKRKAARSRGSSTPNDKIGGGESSEKARSSRRKHHSAAGAPAAAASTEPKVWHKPPTHAAVTAAFSHANEDADDDLETISAEGGAATFSTGTASARKKQAPSEFGEPKSSSGQQPPQLLNPWSRPSLFQRNFADESRNAELFVQLARDRAAQLEKEAQAKDRRAAHAKKKSSLLMAADRVHGGASPHKSTVLHSTSHDEHDDDDEFERIG